MPPAPSPPPSKPQSPLRITHEGEFYARLLTREINSRGNPSFRYYGEGTGAVPFVWESQPGTPKDAYSSSSSRMLATAAGAPAITPPPSYHLRGGGGGGGGAPPLGHSSRRHNNHGKTGGGKLYCRYKLKWPVKVSFIATVFRRLAVFGNKSRSSSSSSPESIKSSSSSSTRWLFSGSGAAEHEARDRQECCGGYDPPEPRKTKARGAVLCLGIRASPWMVHYFCSGGQREQATGWVYGWRP